MHRRVILIEHPPTITTEGGLLVVDFGLNNGNCIAFRPSTWMATRAVVARVTAEWESSIGENVTEFARPEEDAVSG